MDGNALRHHVMRSLETFSESADELRALDQALGDGDLGVTITAGSSAVTAALEELGDDATPTAVARVAAKAFANANPSTFAALVAGALLAGSRTWDGHDHLGVPEAADFVRAAARSIAERGKAEVGDKTVLDAVHAAAEALASVTDPGQARAAVVDAAAGAVEHTTALQSQKGRASWLQERSIGLADPGATAFQRFAEAWSRATESTSPIHRGEESS